MSISEADVAVTEKEKRVGRPQELKEIITAPGYLEEMPKHKLLVDHLYQRPLNAKKVLEISGKWNWVAAGVIKLAQRADNTLYIMDGQHRVQAAMRRADIYSLPCIIFRLKEVSEEAKGFAVSNTYATALSVYDKHRAALVYDDEMAVMVEGLAHDLGRTTASFSSPTTLACIRAIENCAKSDGAALWRIWQLVGKICVGHPLPGTFLRAVWYIEAHLDEGVSLTQKPWREALNRIGFDALEEAMHSAEVYHRLKGYRPAAQGIVDVLNRRRQDKLQITIDIAERRDGDPKRKPGKTW